MLELLIVIAIISLLSSVAFIALSNARVSSRDTARYYQGLEFLKALELYHTETGAYPSGSGATPVPMIDIHPDIASFIGYIPPDFTYAAPIGYLYCASADTSSMAILVNTEKDFGGSQHCVISAGPREYLNSTCTGIESMERCSTRIDT